MYHVYLLKSIKNPNKTYIGFTNTIKERLQKHNEGGSVYTAQDKPWKLVTFVGFDKE
jgi:putative endonuclease